MTSTPRKFTVPMYVRSALIILTIVICTAIVVLTMTNDQPRPIAYYKDVRAIAEQLQNTDAACDSLQPLPADRIGIANQRSTCDLEAGGLATFSTFQLPDQVEEELAPYRARQADYPSLAGTNWVVSLKETPPELVPVFQTLLGGQLYE